MACAFRPARTIWPHLIPSAMGYEGEGPAKLTEAFPGPSLASVPSQQNVLEFVEASVGLCRSQGFEGPELSQAPRGRILIDTYPPVATSQKSPPTPVPVHLPCSQPPGADSSLLSPIGQLRTPCPLRCRQVRKLGLWISVISKGPNSGVTADSSLHYLISLLSHPHTASAESRSTVLSPKFR